MLADYQAIVEKAVRDDSGLIEYNDITDAIGFAVNRYSLDRPQYVVEDIAANGTPTLPLPLQWQLDFSTIDSLEYPIGNFPPNLVETDYYSIYQAPTGFFLRVLITPDDSVRVTYSIAQILTDVVDTIPVKHREAIGCWAAAYCYDQLAGFYAGRTDSTIAAANVDRGAQTRDYAARATKLRQRYYDELGIDPKKSNAASAVVDLLMLNSRGRDRLTHPNRYR